MNTKDTFVPLHAAHAIEQATFVIQFASAIDEPVFSQVLNLMDTFKEDLPGKRELQQVLPAINFPAIPNAVAYAKYNSAGLVENELQAHRNAIYFTTRQYSRWSEIWEKASQFFNQLLPLYASQCVLSSAGLSFTDKFICENIETGFNPSSILKPNSKYIASHVFSTEQLWHSHTGVFERVDDQTKRLININLDYLDERHLGNNRHSLVITSVINDQFNQQSYNPLSLSADELLPFISSHMHAIHISGKDILNNIINEEMSKRIALTD